MKYCALISLLLLALCGCDRIGSYTFKVKNESTKPLMLDFIKSSSRSSRDENSDSVYVKTGEEKTVRIIMGPINSKPHDCLREHGIFYFDDLAFDAYADSVRINKQLWQPDNWTYADVGDWAAEYTLLITDSLLQ